MKIGIIDADLIGRKKHRFPNLVCEKLSAYWKEQGAKVTLKLDYNNLDDFDRVFVSKVFTDTPVPDNLWENKNIYYGGTGFYFDKAPNLPYEIEHHMPDYHLYDSWIESEIENARNMALKKGKVFNEKYFKAQFKEYTDYSIGFMTRGCFRKCKFCVNQKYDHVFLHSPLEEFLDPTRKKICLLDDNILGCSNWKKILEALIDSGKSFKFKQGMDERLLTDEKCQILFNSNYDGDYTFAFDNISDYDLIHQKLHLIRKYVKATTIKFYVLVAFESTDDVDIENAFKRIALLMRYRCLPYLMRYQNKNDTPWTRSRYREIYITLARWCNQPGFFKKLSFREYCEANQERIKTPGRLCTAMRGLKKIEEDRPDIVDKYFDMRFPKEIIDDWIEK
jgi:hypothetical protein